MKRREFLGLIGGAALAVPRAGRSPGAGQDLSSRHTSPALAGHDGSPFGKIIVKALAERGYILGQNLTFDARGAMGDVTRLPALLQELKARNVDAIVVVGYPCGGGGQVDGDSDRWRRSASAIPSKPG